MKKLELKHIAPYLPYDLKGMRSDGGKELYYLAYVSPKSIHPLIWNTVGFGDPTAMDINPILRPLSDAEIILVKYEFLQLGLDTVFNWKNILLILRKGQFSLLPQSLFDVLLRLNVDVFGLIEKGLAIDINTIEK